MVTNMKYYVAKVGDRFLGFDGRLHLDIQQAEVFESFHSAEKKAFELLSRFGAFEIVNLDKIDEE